MANLTKPLPFAAICALLGAPVLLSQPRTRPQQQRPPEKYQAALTRLAAMTGAPVTNWRAHAADLPHGEDPALDDSQWTAITLGGGRGNGAAALPVPGNGHAWYRATVE